MPSSALRHGRGLRPPPAPSSPGPVRSLGADQADQFVVLAGTGGGADQMARFPPGHVAHQLMKQPLTVVNKSGGAGAGADVRARKAIRTDRHPVEPLHDPARDWRAVQLARPDAGLDARA
jgi:hypothetical protein